MSFDKHWNEWAISTNTTEDEVLIHYEAGAQYRQAEIDGLIDMVKTSADSEMYLFEELQRVKKELETLQGMHNAVSLTAGDLLDERDDLQNRIDEASEILSQMKHNGAYKALHILKPRGNPND